MTKKYLFKIILFGLLMNLPTIGYATDIREATETDTAKAEPRAGTLSAAVDEPISQVVSTADEGEIRGIATRLVDEIIHAAVNIFNAKADAIPSDRFKFERPPGRFTRAIVGESDKFLVRTVSDSQIDFAAFFGCHRQYQPTNMEEDKLLAQAGAFFSRQLQRIATDNPYQPGTANPYAAIALWKKDSKGLGFEKHLGFMAQGVQPAFGFAVGAGYKPDEHETIIQSFVDAGVRTLDHQQVIDQTSQKPLGLLSFYCYLDQELSPEDALVALETMYNLAVFERKNNFLLPAENNATLTKQHRTLPHQIYMVTERNGRLDTLLQQYPSYRRHAEEGLNQFYPPKKSVAYTRIILPLEASS